jgi:predicted membrane protein
METSGVLPLLHLSAGDVIGYLWPTALLGVGIKMLLDKNTASAILFLSIGSIFLFTKLFSWNFFAVLWPVAIIAVGLTMIFKKENTHMNMDKKYDDSDRVSEALIFWGVDKRMDSKDFKGGDISAIFGGGKLDLRDAKIHKDGAKLTVNAIFGGVEVLVPKDCKVITTGSGVFGGWESKIPSKDIKSPVLEISGAALFGGVTIKE